MFMLLIAIAFLGLLWGIRAYHKKRYECQISNISTEHQQLARMSHPFQMGSAWEALLWIDIAAIALMIHTLLRN